MLITTRAEQRLLKRLCKQTVRNGYKGAFSFDFHSTSDFDAYNYQRQERDNREMFTRELFLLIFILLRISMLTTTSDKSATTEKLVARALFLVILIILRI